MLKKKINGAWQNCYVVKNKVSGSWVDIKRSGGKPLKRYTNGSWVLIYYPEINRIGYSFGPRGGWNTIYNSNSKITISDHEYDATYPRTTKAYYGTFPVVSGDVLTGSTEYNIYGDSDYNSIKVSIVNFSSSTSTSYSTIYVIRTADSSGGSSQTFSYRFSNSYNNIGLYLETKAAEGVYAMSNVDLYVKNFALNDVEFKIQGEQIFNE